MSLRDLGVRNGDLIVVESTEKTNKLFGSTQLEDRIVVATKPIEVTYLVIGMPEMQLKRVFVEEQDTIKEIRMLILSFLSVDKSEVNIFIFRCFCSIFVF